MLDASHTQGAGLHAIAARATPRVIAVASQGDPHSELPLLWNLCSSLSELSASTVTVLDGTTAEQVGNPGLLQMIQEGPRALSGHRPLHDWWVLPAAHGLRTLRTPSGDSPDALARLGLAMQGQDIVLLYAPAELLESLLANSGVEPLLAVSSTPRSRLTAYQTLKHMVQYAGLRPMLATLVHEPLQSTVQAGRALSQQLQDCAMYFLGYRLEAQTLAAEPTQEVDTAALQKLARRLLERALPLAPQSSHGQPMVGLSNRLVGSH
ncbi:MAG: hypothetical protein RLZZ591_2660 [Pseudomonadota bacterium]|jgi:hypothetical protein